MWSFPAAFDIDSTAISIYLVMATFKPDQKDVAKLRFFSIYFEEYQQEYFISGKFGNLVNKHYVKAVIYIGSI